jgi:hypothetical protein
VGDTREYIYYFVGVVTIAYYSNAVYMSTENLLQNKLEVDMTGKGSEKRKRKKTIVRTAEQSAAEKKKEKKILSSVQ